MKIQAEQVATRPAKGFSLLNMEGMGIIGLILGGAIYTMGGIFGKEVSQADQDMNTLMTGLESYKRNGQLSHE